MNRIILIGNGFDLAHDLKTSYRQFFDDFWQKIINEYNNRIIRLLNDSFENDFLRIPKAAYKFNERFESPKCREFMELLKKESIEYTFKNNFLKVLSKKFHLKNWVDIEEEYYELVKEAMVRYKTTRDSKEIEKLNEEFDRIKKELVKFLDYKTQNIIPVKDFYRLFCDSFHLQDFPYSKEELLMDFLRDSFNSESHNSNNTTNYFNKLKDEIFKDRFFINRNVNTIEDLIELFKKNDSHKKDFLEGKLRIYPQRTLLLNFNYTKTEALYSDFSSYIKNKDTSWASDLPFINFDTIHIHGELNNTDNRIIFGYGDEIADEYKEIEKLNNNNFMKNMKSTEYANTDNYKRLSAFTDSDYFQIYIFGHSCGISDRTLLNTLFEHENCLSIKPFYYEYKDAKTEEVKNNYQEIAINISRNFEKKKAFREKVVNFTYCDPLPQAKK